MHLVWHEILASDDALGLSSPSALDSIPSLFVLPTPLGTSGFFLYYGFFNKLNEAQIFLCGLGFYWWVPHCAFVCQHPFIRASIHHSPSLHYRQFPNTILTCKGFNKQVLFRRYL